MKGSRGTKGQMRKENAPLTEDEIKDLGKRSQKHCF